MRPLAPPRFNLEDLLPAPGGPSAPPVSLSFPTEESRLRREIVEICARMVARGLGTGADGNVSARLSDGDLLITPSGPGKASLDPAAIVRLSHDGTARSFGRPSSEFELHLCAYRERPDVRAVVHAHPPTAVAFTIAGLSLEPPVIPEVVSTLGTIPTAPYATPGTPELAASVRGSVRRCDALLLERHGALTLGRTLEEAFARLEVVEQTAKIVWIARTLGRVKELGPEEVAEILEVRRLLGIPGWNTLASTEEAPPGQDLHR